jgi:hypothetical protein
VDAGSSIRGRIIRRGRFVHDRGAVSAIWTHALRRRPARLPSLSHGGRQRRRAASYMVPGNHRRDRPRKESSLPHGVIHRDDKEHVRRAMEEAACLRCIPPRTDAGKPRCHHAHRREMAWTDHPRARGASTSGTRDALTIRGFAALTV